MKTCVLVEKTDWKREIIYSDERLAPNFWIRQWYFVRLSTEQIDEIEKATTEKVQDILKTL